MEGRGGNVTYPECQHIPKALRQEITEAQALQLPRSDVENVLPLFEKKVSDYTQKKLCSLETNEVLKCRWKSYINNIEGSTQSPFEFPNSRNLHFHNYVLKYMPSLSPGNRPTFRRQMALGPGVDRYGQIPIPRDLNVSKKTVKTKAKPGETSKAKKR